MAEWAVIDWGAGYQPDPILVAPRTFRLQVNLWDHDQINAACDRAQAAFQRHLTPAQQYYWKRWHWCWVEAPSGRLYKIKDVWCWNIEEHEKTGYKTKPKSRWCLSVRAECPAEDRYLTQLLYLRYNEAEFRKVANEDPIYGT